MKGHFLYGSRPQSGTKTIIVRIPLLILAFGFFACSCQAQGTINLTFDGSPVQRSGTATFVQQYYESSMWFRPRGVVGPGNGFVRRGANPSPGWPDNGT